MSRPCIFFNFEIVQWNETCFKILTYTWHLKTKFFIFLTFYKLKNWKILWYLDFHHCTSVEREKKKYIYKRTRKFKSKRKTIPRLNSHVFFSHLTWKDYFIRSAINCKSRLSKLISSWLLFQCMWLDLTYKIYCS